MKYIVYFYVLYKEIHSIIYIVYYTIKFNYGAAATLFDIIVYMER